MLMEGILRDGPAILEKRKKSQPLFFHALVNSYSFQFYNPKPPLWFLGFKALY